jgi:hypothetical protein
LLIVNWGPGQSLYRAFFGWLSLRTARIRKLLSDVGCKYQNSAGNIDLDVVDSARLKSPCNSAPRRVVDIVFPDLGTGGVIVLLKSFFARFFFRRSA